MVFIKENIWVCLEINCIFHWYVIWVNQLRQNQSWMAQNASRISLSSLLLGYLESFKMFQNFLKETLKQCVSNPVELEVKETSCNSLKTLCHQAIERSETSWSQDQEFCWQQCHDYLFSFVFAAINIMSSISSPFSHLVEQMSLLSMDFIKERLLLWHLKAFVPCI